MTLRRAIISVALALFLLPATASAKRIVPLPNPVPPIVYAPCPGVPEAGACAYWQTPFTIYVRVGYRFNLEHELGHAFDRTMLSEGERNRFRTLIHQVGAPWWKSIIGDVGAYSRTSVGEQFADAYANCAVGNGERRTHGGVEWRWETSTSYQPSPLVHRLVCAFIRRAA